MVGIGSNFSFMNQGSIASPRRNDFEMGELIGRTNAGAASALKKRGIFDNIKEFVQSDEGRAALLRSAAGTLKGGLGQGIMDGANFVDQRRASREDARRFDEQDAARDRALDIDQQRANDQYDLGSTGHRINASELVERGRHNRQTERLTGRAQDVDRRGQDVQAAVARRGQDVSARGQDLDFESSMTGHQVSDRNSQRSYDANIYGTNADLVNGRETRAAAGIGSKGPRRKVVQEIEGSKGGWFSDPVPGYKIETEEPLRPAPPPEAIQALRDNPGLRNSFDNKYGVGAAAQYLGGR